MAHTFTDEQLAAINTTDRTVLLSAAAGSGKTATLTERLIRLIVREEDPLDVSRMLIATFTRAAADELRERIRAALARAIEAHPDDKRLARQALLLPSARIRTIDAFCNDIVRGHTEALAISPLYRIPDEAEGALLASELMEELIEDAYSGIFAPAGLDIAELVEIAESVRGKTALSDMLCDLYNKTRSFPRGVRLLADDAEALEKEAALPFFETRSGAVFSAHFVRLFSERRDALHTLFSRAIAVEGAEGLCPKALGAKVLYLLDRLSLLVGAADRSYTALREEADLFDPPKAGSASDDKLSPEGLLCKQYVKKLSDLLKSLPSLLPWEEKDLPFAFTRAATLSRSAYLLLAEFDRRFTEEKRRRSLCDYADLESYAYHLLWDEGGNKTPLAESLAASFDLVSIDEYQDVNEIQHKIFEAVSTERNRFMVGDIKQSIYGFRGALPAIFAHLRATFPSREAEASSAVLFLTRNFRSLPSVIDFANGVFDFLFPTVADSIGYLPEDRLSAGRDAVPDVPTPVFYLLDRPPRDSETAEDAEGEESASREEADLVAEKVEALLKNGRLASDARIRPEDIAVLVRGGQSKFHALTEAFRRHGIPVSVEDKDNFFAHKEILLALCLMHTVNNPRRDVYLSGLLRSPLYGFTLEELLAVRSAAPKRPLFDALETYVAAHPDFEKGVAFLCELAAFRELAKGAPSDRLVRTLFEKTGIYAVADERGRERLRTFYELSRRFEANAFHGLYRFLSHLSDMAEKGKSVEGHRSTDGAVSICTVHASKGLEYPVVLLAFTGAELGRPATRRPPILFSPTLGLSPDIRDEEGVALLRTPMRAAAEWEEEARETEEEVRVLYVALTRAKEQLYIFGKSQKMVKNLLLDAAVFHAVPSFSALANKRSYAAWLLAALGEHSPLCTLRVLPFPYALGEEEAPACASFGMPNDSHAPAATNAEEAPQSEEAFAAARDDALAMYRERFSFVYPFEAASALPGKVSVSTLYPGYLDEEEAPPPVQRPEDSFRPSAPAFLCDSKENDAAAAGTATHLFLQFCDFDALFSEAIPAEQRVEQELTRLRENGFLSSADAARVRTDELVTLTRSALREALTAARATHREFRFNVMLPADAFTEQDRARYRGLSLFVQGVIDLLVEREDGSLLLVDYKTDRLSAAALADPKEAAHTLLSRHADQLTYYTMAAKRIFGRTPAVAIYSLHAGRLFFREES